MFFYIDLKGYKKKRLIILDGNRHYKCKKYKPHRNKYKLYKFNRVLHYSLKQLCKKRKKIKNKRLAQRDAHWLYKRTFVYPSFWDKKIFINSLRRSFKCETAQLSIEAAIVLPVFTFIMIGFMYLFLIIGTDIKVLNAMENTTSQINKNVCLLDFDKEVLTSDLGIKGIFINEYGVDELNDSCIKNGCLGINVGESEYDSEEKVLKMVVDYKIEMPFFGDFISIKRKQVLSSRLFLGKSINKEEEEYVYIAVNGKVYHKDINCTYIKTDIVSITYEELPDLRNSSGGKYKACEICSEDLALEIVEGAYINPKKVLYITNNGDRYHTTLDCYSLNRTFERVKLSETELPPCSKCGGNQE